MKHLFYYYCNVITLTCKYVCLTFIKHVNNKHDFNAKQ